MSILGRNALLKGNIELAEFYFTKVESQEIEMTKEIQENRAYFALYFRKFDLALTIIQQLEPSQEQSKLLALYHYFKAEIPKSLEYAINGGDQELIQHLQQFK